MKPPRLSDWKSGQVQIGVFVRTRDGSTIELVNDPGFAGVMELS